MKRRDFVGAAMYRAEPGEKKEMMLAARLARTPVAPRKRSTAVPASPSHFPRTL